MNYFTTSKKNLQQIKGSDNQWIAMTEIAEKKEIKGDSGYAQTPMLRGGLAHVSETENSITFHDIGSNGSSSAKIIGV